MGNSCNSKTNRKIGGLDVDSRAPGGSWQNADVQVAADPADPTRAKVKVLKVKGPDIYRLVVPVKTKAGKNKDVSVIYEEGEEFCFAEDKTLVLETEAACKTSERPSLKATEHGKDGQTAEEAPTNMRAPVCLDESGRDPYGKDVFGTYDLNGRKKAEEKDVDQLIADHSIFPKALAYNVDDSEDVYTPRDSPPYKPPDSSQYN